MSNVSTANFMCLSIVSIDNFSLNLPLDILPCLGLSYKSIIPFIIPFFCLTVLIIIGFVLLQSGRPKPGSVNKPPRLPGRKIKIPDNRLSGPYSPWGPKKPYINGPSFPGQSGVIFEPPTQASGPRKL